MANAALELLKKEHAAKTAAATRRVKMKGYETMFFRKGAGILTAATYGTLNRLDIPVAVGWFPWKLAVGVGALIVEATTGGRVQAVAAGIGEATNAVYVERSISENTLIVGQGRRSNYLPGGQGGATTPPEGDGGEV